MRYICYRTMADDSSDSEEDPDDWREQRQKFKQQTTQSKPVQKLRTTADKPPL